MGTVGITFLRKSVSVCVEGAFTGKSMRITLQISAAFQFGFLCIKALGSASYNLKFRTRVINTCDKGFIHSKRACAQVLTSDISCQNIDRRRIRITF